MRIKQYNTAPCLVFIGLFSAFFPQHKLFAQACPGLGSVTLNVVAAPVPTLSAPNQLCAGGTGTITINETFSSYAWNTGSSDHSITINGPGFYTVTVTNATGCTGTVAANVDSSPAPFLNITQDNYDCNGNVTLDAGSGFSDYTWSSGGGTNQTATYSSPGLYSVTVTNAQGCTGSGDFDVSIPIVPVVDITGNLAICTGENTTLSATAGFNSYNWSNGQSSQNISITNGGTYTVTVSDAFGCTDTESVTVVAAQPPTPAVADDALCANASVTLSVSNGPFTDYSWSTGSGTSTTLVNAPGFYTVTVTAANGCTGSITANVAALPTPNPGISQSTYTCNGQLVLNASAGFTTYEWSNGNNTATTSVTTSGLYTLTVTNAQGCTGTNSFFANIPAPPVVNITGDNSFCENTSADLAATGGFNIYNWSDGQNGPNISVISSGIYVVTVTDVFGCTSTDTFTVSELPAPQPVVVGPTSICEGVLATFNTTNSFPAYSWSNGQTTPAIIVSAANTYTVTVTAANGCTGTDAQTLNIIAAPAPSITEAIFNCDNQLTLNAGAGFSSYIWSNGNNSASTSVTTSGTYLVTVTNTQGCTGTDSYLASIPALPTVNVTGNNSICPGSSTMLVATAGFNSYDWSTGSTNASISVSAAGNYTVTVTDALGCTATNALSVSLLAAPAPNISGPTQICGSGSATFSVPGAFTSFDWSTGDATPTITVNVANIYTVTVTNANGCTATDSQELQVSNSLQLQITQLPYTCNGQMTLDAGSGFSTYLWQSGQSTQSITINTTGSYSVTVSDAGGCTGTAVINASIPPIPVVAITGNNSICNGSSTSLNATGGFSAYIWSNSQVGTSISTGTAGNYSVTATDAFGCTATSTFILNTVAAPQPVITGPTVICTNSSGTLALNGTFTQYSWSTGATTSTITVNAANTYTVTVTDANGCTGTAAQVVTTANGLSPNIIQLPYTCNGALTLDAGPGFSTYLWSGGANTATLNVTNSGNYALTVTDATGCTGTANLTVTVPVIPQVAITGNSSFCQNTSTMLSATAGFASYLWSNGQTSASISTTTAGTYSVTATDAFGCTATTTFILNAVTTPQPAITGPTVICTNSSGTLALNGTFSQYNWSTGATTSSITVNAANTYAVTVTDANGCTGTATQVVTTANSLSPNIIQLPYTCNGALTLDAGTGFATYLWSGGENTATLNVTNSGNYAVTVTDATGCTGTANLTVTVPTIPQVAITGNSSFCQNATTTLAATTGFNSYLWSNGQTSANISTTTAGNYSVTVTDAFGCTATSTFILNTVTTPQPIITGPTVICTNSSGTLALNSTFNQYSWSTGATTSSITVNFANTYIVTVTDANGCTGTATQVVTTANSLSPNIIQLPYTCNGALTLDAGTGFATYSWSGGENTATLNVNSSGNYAVTVTDATGCTGTANLTVTVPTIPQVTITGNSSFCQNTSTALAATTGFVSYLWSNGDTINTATVNQSGTYTITITDNLGCTATESATVMAQTLPQPQITGPLAVCAGEVATFTLAQNFASYLWSDGTSGATITANTAGTYSITVTDANGCTGTDDAVLLINTNPTATIAAEPYTCNGQLTLTTTAGFTTYNWTGPNGFTANNQQPIITESGTYMVTVTDANGCTGTATQDATIPVITQVTVSGPTQFCSGGSVDLVASSGFISYLWSNGATQSDLTATAVGVYTVTATDALGCTSTASTAVSTFPAPAPVIAGPQAVCPGSTATLSVGGNFTTFNWSTGATTASITAQPPFTATVTVTDANGCTATATASVSVSNQLSPSIVALPYACDGQITLDAGSGFQNYIWSNGQNTAQINATQSGTYLVTVSDGSGCSGTATIEVLLPPVPQVTLSGDTQLCPAEISTLTATAGFATYLWSDGSNLPSTEVSAAGTYLVTVTDGLGCTATASIAVLALSPPLPAITGPTTICGSNPVNLTVTGGTFSSVLWSNAAVTPDITVSAAGTYLVTVTDANGCTGTAQTVLQPGSNLSVNISPQPYTCNGQLTLDAGAGFASYVWSTGGNLQTVTVSQAGIYTVTVTGTGGCSGTATIQITLPADPVVTISGALTFCTGTSTTLIADAGFVTYVWSNGSSQASTVLTQPGIYSVTVTNANGCTATASATVETTSLSPTLQSNEVFCQGTTLTINVTGTYAAYLWSNGSTQSSLTVSQVGTYTVTVTDAAGCTGVSSSTVLAVPPASVNIVGSGTLCTGSSLALTTTGSIGTFAWSNGASGSPLNVTQPGTYSVTVTDPNGCTATASATVIPGAAVTTIINQKTCRQADAGTQVQTLVAASGCDSVVTIITTYQPTIPGLALDLTPLIEAQSGQAVTLNVTGNFSIDSMAFSSPLPLSCTNCLNPVLTATESAVIVVMAFDINGCGATAEVQVIVPRRLEIYVPNVFQPGSNDNGFFTVFSGPEIQSVRNFNVFDRWGNAMFSRADLPTNEPTAGWDGKFRNKIMQPGVYVYYFEVISADGSVEVFKGDVTIAQ